MVEPATLGIVVVDHIMLVWKMRSFSPANRPVKRIYVHTCTKKKKKKRKKEEKKWLFTAGCLQRLEKAGCQWLLSKKNKKLCLSVDLLNDYMRFFTGLYCESLI